MAARLLQVDAFTSSPFAGNPAAVCLLDAPADAGWMQRVAAEMNLSETAFVSPSAGRSDDSTWDLRWFTPAVEVPLCGHATLATAHALWEHELSTAAELRFRTLHSGELVARRLGPRVELDFPAFELVPEEPPAEGLAALGVRPIFAGRTRDQGDGHWEHVLELETAADVRGCRPDLPRLQATGFASWIVTARADAEAGTGVDFVSRFFAPSLGVPEDPVTGRAHCSLVPFWSSRLGRDAVVGYQASARGGFVYGRAAFPRVHLAGDAVTVLRGELVA